MTFDLFARDHASGAFVKVGQAAQTTGKHIEEVDRKSERLSRTFGAVSAGTHGLRASFGILGKGALFAAGAAGVGSLIEAFKGVYEEAREAQKVGAQTNAVIKSTGGAANVSATQVGNLATAISNKVGVDDEAIQSGANLLLTFTGIRNEAGKGNNVFDRATQTVTDMAAAMNQGQVTTDGLKTASIQVGKALNDPIKGITALQKVGVTFDATERKQIATMVAHHNVIGAQKVILGELNKEFGGSAAAGTTAMQKLGVVFGNIKEQVGTALLPAIDTVANWLAARLPGAVATASAFIGRVVTGVKALGSAFRGEGVTSNGFVGVMERIGVVLRAVSMWVDRNVVPALQRFGGFVRGTVLPVVEQFARWLGPILGQAFAAVGRWIIGTAVPALVRFGGFVRGTVLPAVMQFGGFLARSLGPTFSALGTLVMTRIWPALQGLFVRLRQVWPTVQTVVVFVGRLIGILGGLVIMILGKVLPIIIRLAGPVFTLLFAAIGKAIGIIGALLRITVTVTTGMVRVFLTMAGGIINAAAKAFGWVPGLGPKLRTAAAAFNRFRDQVNAALDGTTKPRKITVSATLTTGKVGITPIARQAGGMVPGTGSGDIVPAMLEPGEAVIPKRLVPQIAGWAGQQGIPGFAAGGLVVDPRTSGVGGLRAGVAAFNAQINRLYAQAFAGFGGGGGGPVNLAGLMARGLSAAEAWIIQHESGGRTTAQNPTSTAFGLGQLLIGNRQRIGGILGFSPYTTDWGQQLAMFRYYVRERYGTAENAQAFWQAHGWYGNGLAPTVFDKPTLIGVGESGPETVTVVPHRGGRGTAGTYITVNVQSLDPTAAGKAVRNALRDVLRTEGKTALANQL